MSGILITPGEPEPYGEWGCHRCMPWEAGDRDLLPTTAEKRAREHAGQSGHDVFVVTGTTRALHARNTTEPLFGDAA